MFRRSISLLLLGVGVILMSPVAAVRAEGASCPGHDLLAQMKASDPAAYQRVRAAADAAPNAKTVLWKVESEERPEGPPSYLFATLHFTDDRLKPHSAALDAALSVASRIATGVEDMSADRVIEALSVMHETLLEPNVRLDTLLAKPEAEQTSQLLAKTDWPREWLPRVKPWVATMLTTTSQCEARRIAAGRLTLDGDMEQQAENRGVGSFGIETAEMQFAALGAVPEAAQTSLLKAALAQRAGLDDLTETLVQRYLARDLGALWPTIAELNVAHGADPEAVAAYRQIVIDDRNLRMRDRMLLHFDQGGVFFAVSALHLPGEHGLVALLRNAGYKLTPLE